MNGGAYKALTDADVVKIHNAALDALENIGLADAPESGIELMTKAGAKLTDTGRLLFPRALIEDTVANAARQSEGPGVAPDVRTTKPTIWSTPAMDLRVIAAAATPGSLPRWVSISPNSTRNPRIFT
jgi:hypothetical protein